MKKQTREQIALKILKAIPVATANNIPYYSPNIGIKYIQQTVPNVQNKLLQAKVNDYNII